MVQKGRLLFLLAIAAAIVSFTPYSHAQNYLLRAHEQVVTASVHRDNCIVVHPDGSFVVEQADTKSQPKPDVFASKLNDEQLQKLKQMVDNPDLAKLGSVHQGTRGAAEGNRVEMFDAAIPRHGKAQDIRFTRQDGNPSYPAALQPVVDWVEGQFDANLPPAKGMRASGCGGAGAIHVKEAPGSAKH